VHDPNEDHSTGDHAATSSGPFRYRPTEPADLIWQLNTRPAIPGTREAGHKREGELARFHMEAVGRLIIPGDLDQDSTFVGIEIAGHIREALTEH